MKNCTKRTFILNIHYLHIIVLLLVILDMLLLLYLL